MRRALVVASLLVALLQVEKDAEASPEDLFGYGARTSAMGATGITHATGGETAYHNPALASRARDKSLTLGLSEALFRLGGVTDEKPAKGVVIGAGVPLLPGRLGLSLALYTPTDVVVRGRVLYPEVPQYPLLPDRAQSVTLRAGAGLYLGHGLRVGVGVAALAELVGNVVAATDATGRVGTTVEEQLVATYAPTVGVNWDATEHVRVGLTARGTLDARFAVTVDGTKLSTIPIPAFNIAGTAQYDPAQVALEVAYGSFGQILALQGVYKRWSDFPGLLEPTVVCTETPSCGLHPSKIDWRDTFVVRVGVEDKYRITEGAVFALRSGAFLETSSLPPRLPTSQRYTNATTAETVPTRYLDSARLAFTFGMGIAVDQFGLDLFAQEHFLLSRDLTSGTSAFESNGHVHVLGLSGTVWF